MSRIAFLLGAALLGAAPVGAQTVVGRILGAGTDQPVVAAFVSLRDSAGVQAAAGLSGEDGAFSVRARTAGRYVLRVERLGFAIYTSEPFALAAGERVTRELRLPEQAIALGAIDVRAERRGCRSHGELSAQTAALWEEARKALTVASWSAIHGELRFGIARWLRQTNASNGNVLIDETERGVRNARGTPWASASPARLAAQGFVQPRGRAFAYYGPDAALLLSDVFLEGHCFELEEHPSDASLVGLGFRPRGDRDVADIAGVLWLRRDGAALHSIEFDYVNLPLGAGGKPGGRIGFRRVGSGAWIMSEWVLRLHGAPSATSPGSAPKAVITEHGARVVEALDAAGRVLFHEPGTGDGDASDVPDLHLAGGTMPPRLFAALMCGRSPGPGAVHAAGFVGTSPRAPLQGATVRLRWGGIDERGGQDAATDAHGLFWLCDVPVDTRVRLEATHPGFGSAAHETQAVEGGSIGHHFILRAAQ